METRTGGQIAYEAYAASTGWKSAVSGAPLPQWSAQSLVIHVAWEAAASAVTAALITAAPETIEKMAGAILNARGMRRGAPPITNVMEFAPKGIAELARWDAEAALGVLFPGKP